MDSARDSHELQVGPRACPVGATMGLGLHSMYYPWVSRDWV